MQELRALGIEDLEASYALSVEAFGAGQDPAYAARVRERIEKLPNWGLYESGTLIAQLVDRPYQQWFGGRPVACSGIASVAVRADYRGRGHARALLTLALEKLRERGAAVSSLHPTTLGPYRATGWEYVGDLSWERVPTLALRSAAFQSKKAEVRAARAEDARLVVQCYEALAARTNGLLARQGPLFALPPVEGCSVVSEDGGIRGYLLYERGQGYGANAVLTVYELVAHDPDAARALLGLLGSWSSVTPTLRWRGTALAPLPSLLPRSHFRREDAQPWMLRIVDAARAIHERGWPSAARCELELVLIDREAPWNAGPHRFVVKEGQGHLERGGAGGLLLDVRGLAALYSGGACAAGLRSAGLLSGGDAALDAQLDAVFAGPAPILLDYW